jgi:hypothetical protein
VHHLTRVLTLPLLLLTIASLTAADAPEVTVTWSLAKGAESRGSAVKGKVRLEPLGAGPAVEAELNQDGPTRVPVAAGFYRLRIEAPGLWSGERMVEAGEETDVVLHPTGELAGRLLVPRGENLPERLVVRFRNPAPLGEKSSVEGETECPVPAKGDFVCSLPGLRLDLELRAEAFVPVYLWDEPVTANERRRLADVELRGGASVVGWVIDEGAEQGPREGVEVELVPRTGETPGEPLPAVTADRLRLVQRRVRPGDRGFFQLFGVPPGTYRVAARGPGGAVSEAAEVEVDARREIRLAHPLVLRPPVRLEVVVDPPVAPAGEPWELTLTPLARTPGGRRVEHRKATADWGGAWVAEKLEPGQYRLMVGVGGATPGREQRWWMDVVAVEPPVTFLPVSLAWVDVEGELRGEEGPVSGVLFFGGHYGSPRITLEADDEGRFAGALPREGTWQVEFAAAAEDSQVMRLDDVEVEVGPSGKALLELRLSGLRLAGRVVTAEGEPAAGAFVRVLSSERRSKEAEATADGQGRFELVHLRRGEVWVEAEGSAGRAAPLRVELGEAPAEPLELVLRGESELAGRVASAGRGVAGALVRTVPVLPGGAPFSVARVLTDPGGEFRVALPDEAQAVHLLVASPGLATVWRRVDLPAGEVAVDLPIEGGRLTATFDGPPGAVLVGEAGELGLHLVADRIGREGTAPSGGIGGERTVMHFELDRLAAGTYRLCPVELPATIRYDLCKALAITNGSEHDLHFGPEQSR